MSALRISVTALLIALGSAAIAADTVQPGMLVIAPDRGYMGNEEARDAFARIDVGNKALVFITDEDSRKYLNAAIENLVSGGAGELAVLPYFLSGSHPGWQMAKSWLEGDACAGVRVCTFSKPFGHSYFAVDLLDEALADVDADGKSLIIVGAVADGGDSLQDMALDWKDLATSAADGMSFDSITPVVWDRSGDYETQSSRLKSLADDKDAILVSYNFGWKLDSMMSFDATLKRRVLKDAVADVVIANVPAETAGTWMQREANRALIRGPEDVGVVIQAHGSNFHWNERMREAVAPLHDKYAVEYAFSMADRPSIEAAIRRLEKRGVKAAVVVRVFGREDSFKSTIENLLGMDVENREPGAHANHGSHGGHMMAAGRIHSSLVLTSTGGLGDHPLFAEGLLARTSEISTDPSRETVIVVAHGLGDDAANARWIEILESLAQKMRAIGGDEYRAIHVATWREDWPDKREEWVAHVRKMVEEAGADGGHALIIPARTNSGGPAQEFLEGLEFTEGKGFAPHPLFTRWVESQIIEGVRVLHAGPDSSNPREIRAASN